MTLRGQRHQGMFGGLDNGTARPVLSPDALAVSRNTEHFRGGSIQKRPGRSVQCQIASQPSPFCAPLLDSEFYSTAHLVTNDGGLTFTGGLTNGVTYYARVTYVTAAGETDDLHSNDPAHPEPATLEWVATNNAARISVPFHIRNTAIEEFSHNAGGYITLKLAQPAIGDGSPVLPCDPTIYQGWLVYSRSPRIQDETNLGANADSADPLYHRVQPWARVTFFNPIDYVLTLDRKIDEVGETGWLDKDHIDFMMPDRAGLPILSFNVYLSVDNVNFFYAATGNDGSRPVDVLEYDDTATRAPSTRVDRSAPTVAAVDVTQAVPGLCGPQAADTRIEAGVYGIRTTWTTGDLAVMGDPGFLEQCRLNGAAQDQPPLRYPQETWPSNQVLVALRDGQGIEVTPPPGPDINEGWNVYAKKLRPLLTIDFTDSVRPGTQVFNPKLFSQSTAVYYYGDIVFPTLPANDFADGPELSFGGTNLYDEFRNTSVIISAPLDPFASTTRGFPPGYPDILTPLDGNGVPYFSYASSRDAINKNRQLYWFYLDAASQAIAAQCPYALFRITLRTRPGRQAAYSSSTGQTVNIRLWDQGGGVFTPLATDLGPLDWFTTYGYPFDFDSSLYISGGAGNPTDRFVVVDLYALNAVGFDVDSVQLEFYGNETGEEVDPLPDDDEVLQRGGIRPILDDSYTLQNPLVERPYLTDGDDPGVGEYESIRPNNTAQWPVVVASLPIVGAKASSPETKVNFLGCADSCFRDAGGGIVERIYQQEGQYWNSSLRHDWRVENYLNRVFLLTEAEPRWNLRFDGLATYPHGLPKPFSGITADDLADGFGTGQGEIPIGTLYGDRCLEEELFAGQIISTSEIDTPEGKLDPNGNVVVGFDLEYYVVYKRRDPATGRSYVVRSEPAQFTKTTRVRGTVDFEPTLYVEGWLTPEPQVTHIEFYRNSFMTADYYLVSDIVIGPDGKIPDYSNEGVRITDDVVDPATCRCFIQFSDTISLTDADLTLPIQFETGRPTAAVMMRFHRGRLFFVQQRERTILAFTNISSASGDIDPEGFFVQHVIDPPVRESAAITCLSVYNDGLVASCNTGMVSVQGISDKLNSPDALSPSLLASNSGWGGPDAFMDINGTHWGAARQGPAFLGGGELEFIGPPIEGTLYDAILTTDALFDMRCCYFRSDGRSQAWFTYKTDPNSLMSKILVFDEEVDQTGDNSQFWKEWTEMPVHGLSLARDADGNEYPLLGGFNGRTYRHGLCATDAGLLIEHDIQTRPFESPTPSVTFSPRWAYFYTSGEPDDVMMLDVLADFEDIARNAEPIPIQMGGNLETIWGEFIWSNPADDESIWGAQGDRPWTDDRIAMGGTFQQIAFRLYLTWETWPVGKSRSIQFETTGFNPYDIQLGIRNAKASTRR